MAAQGLQQGQGQAAEPAEDLGVRVHHRYNHVFHGITVSGPLVDREVLESLYGVRRVHEDMQISIKTDVPWNLDRLDQNDLPLDDSFTRAYTGAGVDIYIIDTGLDTTHHAFQNTGVSRTVANIFSEFGDATAANTDGDGHGTHCAGTAAGQYYGAAPAANVYGMKVLSDEGSGSTGGIIDAMDAVIARVNNPSTYGSNRAVINMSLGGPCDGGDTQCSSDALYANACYSTPASATSAITVGATRSDDYISTFSNFGACVDILSPGTDIRSACSQLVNGCMASDSYYMTMSGTSMASPLVAGVVAQFLEKHPTATRTQMLEMMYCAGPANKISYMDAARSASDAFTKNFLIAVPTSNEDFSTCSSDLGNGCTNSCSGHGVCMAQTKDSNTNVCKCFSGYYTDDCSSFARSAVTHSCSNTLTTFDMYDWGEDGWDKGYYVIKDSTTGATVSDAYDALYSGPYAGRRFHCLPDGCYDIYVAEGDYPGEIAWVFGSNGDKLFQGGAPWSQTYCVSSAGVTPMCDGGGIVDLVVKDSYGDGWQGSYYKITHESQGITHRGYPPYSTELNNYENTHKLCLAWGCSTLSIAGDDEYPEENSWIFGGVTGDMEGGPTTATVCVELPTSTPTGQPSKLPTTSTPTYSHAPTESPTVEPTTAAPTEAPTISHTPTSQPSISHTPTGQPTGQPSASPSFVYHLTAALNYQFETNSFPCSSITDYVEDIIIAGVAKTMNVPISAVTDLTVSAVVDRRFSRRLAAGEWVINFTLVAPIPDTAISVGVTPSQFVSDMADTMSTSLASGAFFSNVAAAVSESTPGDADAANILSWTATDPAVSVDSTSIVHVDFSPSAVPTAAPTVESSSWFAENIGIVLGTAGGLTLLGCMAYIAAFSRTNKKQNDVQKTYSDVEKNDNDDDAADDDTIIYREAIAIPKEN
eukprot:GSChrysophyteH2.ASY1.ANO1.154.1 assembled CDS